MEELYLYTHPFTKTYILLPPPSLPPFLHQNNQESTPFQSPKHAKPIPSFTRYIHSSQRTELSDSASDPKLDPEESEEDGTMNEFLSRFVWIMRRKLSEVYSDCDKKTIDGMLVIIVEKVISEMEKGGLEQMLGSVEATPSHDFSEDLWKTVWEVSNEVLDDMRKARKKEKMKGFLQSEEVKEMYRFTGEVGIRGEMLREMRFKWAREKMEESEFYQSLERFREEESHFQKREEAVHNKSEIMGEEAVGYDSVVDEEKPKVVSLPKRHGKIRYKIYGLDLSDPKWAEVADKIRETEKVISPQEPKPISGKCKRLLKESFH
ncbi:pentatricopeptide (PPR) repeat-containing protein [Actinidia rufa]|uniref:Pentatricopeptide (PPR) repeat-containing protein n=1 Tax=Actinidia rufa TaxID=165716 RepID=A0A7J0DTS2_9ERIC|nr:pentatricopeptide (PPR) repeat-containing protein [Actinidia rufa]